MSDYWANLPRPPTPSGGSSSCCTSGSEPSRSRPSSPPFSPVEPSSPPPTSSARSHPRSSTSPGEPAPGDEPGARLTTVLLLFARSRPASVGGGDSGSPFAMREERASRSVPTRRSSRTRRDSPGRLRRCSRIHGEATLWAVGASADGRVSQPREGGSRAFARASAAPASFRQCARPDRELARADVLPMHRMPRAQPSGALAHRPRQSSRQRGLGRLLLHANGSSGHVRELSFSDPSLPIRCRIRSRAEDVIQAGLSGRRVFSYL
jgi:hypothetical protein